MSYVLTPRQQRVYNHLCDIVSIGRSVDVNAKPGNETYTLIDTSVPCHYEYTDNVSDEIPGMGFRLKRTMIFTLDKLHLPVNAPADDGYFVINRSQLPDDGGNHPLYGEVHRIEGEPKKLANDGARRANKQVAFAAVVEDPPTAVKALI